jgi:ribose transport system ATP-binding protein
VTEAPAVRMTGVVKSFSGVRVLDDVDFELAPGEVHALVGGNGAGKSTLMKILEGVYSLDEGRIEVGGEPVGFGSAQDARAHGVAMIFQEFSLIPTLTVAQNVFLARESRGALGLLDDRESERRTQTLFADMGVEIDPRAIVEQLSTAYWQLTEIAKALSQNAQVLIMDEPTSSLAKSETEALFALMQRLKERGISIVYISHRMEEVFAVADRITILRDGRRVLTEPVSRVTMEQAIDGIVGAKVEQAMGWKERHVQSGTETVLEARELVSSPRVRGISFQVHAGEIVGLAGLMGSGRSETARLLFGVDALESGEILVRGRPIAVGSPQDAIAAGIALIPEDRRAQGLVLDHPVKDNLLLPLLGSLTRAGFVDDRAGNRLAQQLVQKLKVRAASIFQPVKLLSGGNQQKVVIAKWLAKDPEILILDEPTAGVDIGTKGEIVERMRELADAGKAILIISSELPELLAVSDRVLVLKEGRVARELARNEIDSEESLHRFIQEAA